MSNIKPAKNIPVLRARVFFLTQEEGGVKDPPSALSFSALGRSPTSLQKPETPHKYFQPEGNLKNINSHLSGVSRQLMGGEVKASLEVAVQYKDSQGFTQHHEIHIEQGQGRVGSWGLIRLWGGGPVGQGKVVRQGEVGAAAGAGAPQ